MEQTVERNFSRPKKLAGTVDLPGEPAIALTALEAMGWENALCLKGGSFAGWVEAGYPVQTGVLPEKVALNEASPDPDAVAAVAEMLHNVPDGYGVFAADALSTALIEDPEIILLDVRRADEVESKGYIDAENVVYIPLEEFVAQKDMWPAEDAKIVTYCGSGHRSTIAMAVLWSYGYTDVNSLKGGFSAWVEGGYPVAGAPLDLDAPFTVFLNDMEAYNTISVAVAYEKMVAGEDVFFLDVREPSELESKGWIEGAVNIPLREIADNVEYLPSEDTTIISYCGSGWRCTIALTALEALGWENVLGLKDGSYAGWVEAGYPTQSGAIPALIEYDEADPNAALIKAIDAMLESVPEGYGVVTAEALSTELIENPDIVLVDVRTPAEVAGKGYIDHGNVVFVPLEEFVAQKGLWPAKDAKIVTYCGSGHRSTIAMTILWSYGYTDVHSLKGGFTGWVDAGYPVVAAP